MRHVCRWSVCFGFVLFVGTAVTPGGQDAKPEPHAVVVGKIESLSWSATDNTLRWIASEGEVKDGRYFPKKETAYAVDLGRARMTAEGQTYLFEPYEAVLVGRNVRLLAEYAVDATEWWKQGGGPSRQRAIVQGR